ncbi:unnamed protein product [Adineta ricciae]|uniref:Uncharacterized protein n=1 Tax=Adineta ricciae TaxID=249248 RepID=A0A813R616_ADIRI|nr:unnamed protein product [Adineta ricciae]CAF0775737.1 unnamed protein product [Adineta ricciae]
MEQSLSLQSCSIELCELSVLIICECHNKRFCNDHFIEHINKPEATSTGTKQPKDTTYTRRPCFSVFNGWWRYFYGRMTCSSSERNKQEVELQQTEDVTTITKASVTKARSERKVRTKSHRGNLFPLKEPDQTVQTREKNSVAMACSKKHLLIEQKPNLSLFDRKLNLIKQIPWSYMHVNIYWASALERFILVTHKDIFTLDENTMELEEQPIVHHNKKDWSGAACSETVLYLSTMDMSPCLYQYSLLPSIEFIKEQQLGVMCLLYESILTFSYANERLAFIICNAQTFQNRLELHSSVTFDVLWILPLNVLARCCPIRVDQWLIINSLDSQILHISSDGTILQNYIHRSSSMNPIINAVQWDKQTLVTVSLNTLHLHKLSL